MENSGLKCRGAKYFLQCVEVLVLALPSVAFAQFGGRPGDVVIYALTSNGGGDFQVMPVTTTNSPQDVASFHVTSLDSVPFSSSDPFPLKRQVLYETNTELFEVLTDVENTVGLHRLFIVPAKIFEIEGIINPYGTVLGFPNTAISYPQGLDVEGDKILETLKIITWTPKNWPFIVLTDQPGPLRPPDIPGYVYFFQIPGAVKVAALVPWSNMSALYSGAGWQDGIDLKLLDIDPALGTTIRQMRLRPGRRTPLFRIPGHTHLFVLQGSVALTPANSSALTMRANDYAYLPENFSISLANPQQ